jgi:PTS system glucitol/sorbitol-specific IIC component
MDFIVKLAEMFIGFIEHAGDTFLSMVSGQVPMLVVLLTLIHFIVRAIGENKVNAGARFLGRWKLLTYGVLPSFSWFFFSSPGAVTVGKFLPEKAKPGFQDALGRSVHPLTSLFPHVVPAELFIWLGVSAGIEKLGLPIISLAIRYIIVGVIVGIVSGIITESVFKIIAKKNNYYPDKEV